MRQMIRFFALIYFFFSFNATFAGIGDGISDSSNNPISWNSTTQSRTGTGYFNWQQTIDVQAWPNALIAADFNNDGYPDIASSDFNSSQISIMLNDGTGGFQQNSTPFVGPGTYRLFCR